MSRAIGNALKSLLFVAGLMFLSGVCHATDVGYTGTFQGTEGPASVTGTAISNNYTRDINTTGDRISLQVVHSSYTLAVSTTFTSANYTLNTPTITISGNNFVTGQQVLYSTGTLAISGLTNQTTYYISVINPNTKGVSSTIKLSSSLANAQAGTGIVLASSSSVSNVYTLAPLAFTNTSNAGIQVQWSDDGVTYFNATTGNYGATISSVTFAIGGGSTLYDFGPIQHRYMRLKETPPTTGAVAYTATDNERYSFKH